MSILARLTWTEPTTPTDVDPVIGYRLYRSTSGGPYVLIVDIPSPDTLTYDDGTIDEETSYVYRITGYTVAGETDPSNLVGINVGGPQTTTLSGELGTDEQTALLSWLEADTTGGPITGYKLYRDGVQIYDTMSAAILSYEDAGLAADTEYEYVVRAYTELTVGPDSNTVILDTGHPGTITEIYDVAGSFTWTKNAFLVSADVTVIGGAGGGGGGCLSGSGGESSTGGQGGGGGEYRSGTFLAAALNATETVTVGAGGTGGAALTGSTGANGNIGNNGGNSSFGAHIVAKSGRGGARGVYTGTAGNNGLGGGQTGNTGGSGGTLIVAGGTGGSGPSHGTSPPGGSSTYGGGGGGAGGGRDNETSSTSSAGGAGGTTPGSAAGGAGGALSTNGSPGTNSSVLAGGGGGGGGGTSQSAGNPNLHGGNGAAGGGYGGGGGGGGSSRNAPGPATSGAGGLGKSGVVVVVSHLS